MQCFENFGGGRIRNFGGALAPRLLCDLGVRHRTTARWPRCPQSGSSQQS